MIFIKKNLLLYFIKGAFVNWFYGKHLYPMILFNALKFVSWSILTALFPSTFGKLYWRIYLDEHFRSNIDYLGS
ncbi:MAG: hypothetical protein D6732_18725 [Methanobacteriota archaeon]|nr:MAG: hypothetical protein D6732_18725 [Euryarchaeota archaeon]